MSKSDFPKLDELFKRLGEAAKRDVVVGYPVASGAQLHEDAGITNAQLAARLSFGDPEKGLPARPFLDQGMKSGQKKVVGALAQGLRKALRGEASVDDAFHLAGAVAVEEIKVEVRRGGQLAPNKADTIKRKGSSTPLIDEGNMLDAMTSEVRNAGSQ
ncbi:conserved hypothetical protein [Paraburkholderia atlantica]|uniref:Bacteriophage protein n=1 Tax=Paraburkholderia atlantica TaxID=2654982 RepID=D5WME5_PARAM|nr:hypothetical protein [Paraburkholderia atlantica]ADG20391.1 conserved hypothetical protein [Paraburkholderia atlantica]